jgi:hypothetical protein
MFAILGSGFGLYGYLPALVDGSAQRIVLPDRYRTRFSARSELARFINDVQWKSEETVALDCAEGAALALRPIDQVDWLHQCLVRSNIERLLLEKPLAQSPEIAAVMFDNLIRSGKVFRIGYTFRYTIWGMQLLDFLRSKTGAGPLSIHWHFLAHHFRNNLRNWKRFNATGGGAIRFYGIHIIALLAEIGYRDVALSRSFGISSEEIETWTAIFAGSGLPECEIVVDTRAIVSKFRVEQTVNTGDGPTISVFANLSDPFDLENELRQSNGIDQRVPILIRLCRSLWENGTNDYGWYDAAIKLWCNVEEKTLFEGPIVDGRHIPGTLGKEREGAVRG